MNQPSPSIHKLFSGKFYIHEAFGIALSSLVLQSFAGVAFVEKSDEQMELEIFNRADLKGNIMADSGNVMQSQVIAVIDFKQPVLKYSTWYWMGTQSYIRLLNRLKNDDSIAGIVLDVDSGGGQVYGTPEFHDVIAEIDKIKPIVVYTNGLLCSGAFYFSAASRWIVANRRADAIGSIGVYTVLVNFDAMWEKYGAQIHTIYSSLSTKKNKAHRDVMEGNDPDYKQYISIELDPIAEQFIADMKIDRPQMKEEVFQGGVWNGEAALEMGLVDQNGSLETAIAKCWEFANTSNSNQNKNSKKKSMSKTTKAFPTLQKLIGVEGPGLKTISTVLGNKGVQVSEENLALIESALAGKDAAIKKEKDAATEAQGQVTALGTAVDTAVKTAGLESELAADANTEAKITLLGNKVVEFGKKPGAQTSKPGSTGDNFAGDTDAVVDANDAHNKLYNDL